VQAEGSNRSNY